MTMPYGLNDAGRDDTRAQRQLPPPSQPGRLQTTIGAGAVVEAITPVSRLVSGRRRRLLPAAPERAGARQLAALRPRCRKQGALTTSLGAGAEPPHARLVSASISVRL